MKERIPYDFYINKNIIFYCQHTDWGIIFHLLHNEGKGYCKLYSYNDDPDIWYISDLNISENYRNMGIGTNFMNVCIDICKRYNGQKIQLQVYDNAEQFIHDWYKRLGFYEFIHSKRKEYSWLTKSI